LPFVQVIHTISFAKRPQDSPPVAVAALLSGIALLERGLPNGCRMSYDGFEATMSKRELIAEELQRLPEADLDKLLQFLRSLKESHAENAVPTLAAESSLAKDWLTPEEEAAWASL